MTTPMSNLAFNGMSMLFKVRDLVSPRRQILEEAGLRFGDRVLDYGCGPGAYVADAAEMVGRSGKVYALDIHPLAIKRVQAIIEKRGLTNVETIQSSCRTGLPDGSLDVVLMYDVFHMLDNPQAVLVELRRVLKPHGALSLNDPHLAHDAVVTGVVGSRLFTLLERGKKTYTFVPRVMGGGIE